jgi:hypothetical protein
MISGMRSALLAASLLLPAAAPAMAASPEAGHYVWVPPGATLVLVPATRAAPVDFPVARMIAQQDAMMQRMMADMDSLMAMPLPDPQQMIRSVMNGIPQIGPGSGVVVTSITTGNGTCTQTITYGPQPNGGAPVVKTSSSGNACGALGSSPPVGVTQPLPAAPRQDRVWSVEYPARPVTRHTPPRT